MAKKGQNLKKIEQFFCISKIDIHTNLHEYSSKIDCSIGHNRQKTSVTNLLAATLYGTQVRRFYGYFVYIFLLLVNGHPNLKSS